MLLVNGHESDYISIYDRGLQYGDGLFETIEVYNGRPVFVDRHLQRLELGCKTLNITSLDYHGLKNEINRLCKPHRHAVLKIIITRGSGGRGYRAPDNIYPTRVVGLFPAPNYPESYYSEGVNTVFCNTRLGLNPALAGIKHLNRLEQVIARSEWDDPAIAEGFMLDMNNHVIEGTMTNLFYVKNEQVFTASLELTGVSGIIRGVIKQLLLNHNLELTEHNYQKDCLLAADEVFVSNSIIGIWPVKRIEKTNFQAGTLTKQLQLWLIEAKLAELSYET